MESDSNYNDFQTGDVPLYLQIAALLRQRIFDGYWKPKDRLPTLEQLMSEFKVARATVRQAISLLYGEGLIERQRGRGTFVRERQKLPQVVLSALTDWDTLIAHFSVGKPFLIETKKAESLPSWATNIPKLSDSYQFISRTQVTKNITYLVNNIYLDEAIYQLAPFDIIHGHAIKIISEMPQITLTSCQQTYSFGVADARIANLLEVPVNSAVGNMYRVIRDNRGIAIVLVQNWYRADIMTIEINVSLQNYSKGSEVRKL